MGVKGAGCPQQDEQGANCPDRGDFKVGEPGNTKTDDDPHPSVDLCSSQGTERSGAQDQVIEQWHRRF